MVSPGARHQPPPEAWKNADLRTDGTVEFGSEGKRWQFEVLRDQVLRIWPNQPSPCGDIPERNKGGRPTAFNKVAEILDKFQADNPVFAENIEQIPFKSLAHRIRREAGKEVDDQGWGETTLRQHVRRWLLSKRSRG
jgi:hypothetical protein